MVKSIQQIIDEQMNLDNLIEDALTSKYIPLNFNKKVDTKPQRFIDKTQEAKKANYIINNKQSNADEYYEILKFLKEKEANKYRPSTFEKIGNFFNATSLGLGKSIVDTSSGVVRLSNWLANKTNPFYPKNQYEKIKNNLDKFDNLAESIVDNELKILSKGNKDYYDNLQQKEAISEYLYPLPNTIISNTVKTGTKLGKAKNALKVGTQALIPGFTWNSPKAMTLQAGLSTLFEEMHQADRDAKGLILDYRRPDVNNIKTSIMFDNIGNINKDKPYTMAYNKKTGRQYYKEFLLDQNNIKWNDYYRNHETIDNLKYSIPLTILAAYAGRKGFQKTTQFMIDKYKNKNANIPPLDMEKIDRILDDMTFSQRNRTVFTDKYEVVNYMMDKHQLSKNYIPFFYRDTNGMKDAIYNTGVLSDKIKFKQSPKATDILISSYKNNNPEEYKQFDKFLNDYNKIQFLSETKKHSLKNILKNKKYRNFLAEYKMYKDNPITNEIMDLISDQNNTINKLFVDEGILKEMPNQLGKYNLQKRLIYAVDDSFLNKLLDKFNNKSMISNNIHRFVTPFEKYDDLLVANRKNLNKSFDIVNKNKMKKEFINNRLRVQKNYQNTILHNTSNRLFNLKDLDLAPQITTKAKTDIAKEFNIRYMGKVSYDDYLKEFKELSYTDNLDSQNFSSILFGDVKKKDIQIESMNDIKELLDDVYTPSTNKAINFLQNNKNINNTLTVYDKDGILVYKVDEAIGAMFNDFDNLSTNIFQDYNRMFKRFIEKTTTGKLNPAFSLKSWKYTVDETTTAMNKIIDDIQAANIESKKIINDRLKAYNKTLSKGYSKEIKNAELLELDELEKAIKENSNLYEKFKDIFDLKDNYISEQIDYMKKIHKAGKDMIAQKRAADIVNKQAKILADTILQGGATKEELELFKVNLEKAEKDYTNLLTTRLQLGGYIPEKPATNLGHKVFNLDNPQDLEKLRQKGIDSDLIKTIDFYQTMIRESPNLGLVEMLGERFGYINNGRVINKAGMEEITKAISRNTATTNTKGNYLGKRGSIAKFIDNDMIYGGITMKSLAAKSQSMKLGKGIDAALDDVKQFMTTDISYGDFIDLIGQQLSYGLKNNKGLERAIATWGTIGLGTYLYNNRDHESSVLYKKTPRYERTSGIILSNALGNGESIKIPIDQEYGILFQLSYLIADKMFNLEEQEEINPELNKYNDVLAALGRSVIPGDIPLLTQTTALTGHSVDLDTFSDFGGIHEPKEHFINNYGFESRYEDGIIPTYAHNLLENFFGMYGTFLGNFIEEGNASLKSESFIKDSSQQIIEQFTRPITSLTTSKISKYNETNNYLYEIKNKIDNYNKADNKAKQNDMQSTAHQFVVDFRRNYIYPLEQIRSNAIDQYNKQKTNNDSRLVIDYNGRKFRINNIEDFLIKLNNKMYARYQQLDNSLYLYMYRNFGIDGVTLDNYMEKLK